jgi:hypothetical protein
MKQKRTMNITRSLPKAQHLFIILLIIELASLSAYAQKFNRAKPKRLTVYGKMQTGTFTVGVLGSLSAPAVGFKSDIVEFNGLNAQEEGASAGLIAGFRGIDIQLVKGIYSSSNTMLQRVDMKTFEGAAHVYPLQFLSRKRRFIEPYVLSGVADHDYKLYGTSNPQVQVQQQMAPPHLCQMPGMEPPPLQVVPEEPAPLTETAETVPGELKYIGTVNVTRCNAGMGMVIHIYGKHTFINLFTEYKFGFPVKVVSAQEVLENTRVTIQKTIHVGISFGIR